MFRWATLITALAVMTPRATATHTVDMPLPRLADEAAHVIIGRVESIECRATRAAHGIESVVHLTGITWLKGAYDGAGTNYELVVPGGTIDGRTLRLCCAPEFEIGAAYLLFLRDDWRVHPVVGLNQGALRLASDGSLRRADSDLPVLAIEPDGRVVVGPTAVAPRAITPGAARPGPGTRVVPRAPLITSPLPARTALARVRAAMVGARAQRVPHAVRAARDVDLTPVPLREARR